MTPSEALNKLLQGNKAFMTSMARRNQTVDERAALGKGQAPFASILSCADSRTTPEIVFNQGLGDMYVVRVAGNVATSYVRGSLEFAVTVFKTPLIIVMGHSDCGAMQAAIDAVSGATFSGGIAELVDLSRPIAEATKTKVNWLEAATRLNVRESVTNLRNQAVLAALLKRGSLAIVGAYYNVSTGQATIIDGE